MVRTRVSKKKHYPTQRPYIGIVMLPPMATLYVDLISTKNLSCYLTTVLKILLKTLNLDDLIYEGSKAFKGGTSLTIAIRLAVTTGTGNRYTFLDHFSIARVSEYFAFTHKL